MAQTNNEKTAQIGQYNIRDSDSFVQDNESASAARKALSLYLPVESRETVAEQILSRKEDFILPTEHGSIGFTMQEWDEIISVYGMGRYREILSECTEHGFLEAEQEETVRNKSVKYEDLEEEARQDAEDVLFREINSEEFQRAVEESIDEASMLHEELNQNEIHQLKTEVFQRLYPEKYNDFLKTNVPGDEVYYKDLGQKQKKEINKEAWEAWVDKKSASLQQSVQKDFRFRFQVMKAEINTQITKEEEEEFAGNMLAANEYGIAAEQSAVITNDFASTVMLFNPESAENARGDILEYLKKANKGAKDGRRINWETLTNRCTDAAKKAYTEDYRDQGGYRKALKVLYRNMKEGLPFLADTQSQDFSSFFRSVSIWRIITEKKKEKEEKKRVQLMMLSSPILWEKEKERDKEIDKAAKELQHKIEEIQRTGQEMTVDFGVFELAFRKTEQQGRDGVQVFLDGKEKTAKEVADIAKDLSYRLLNKEGKIIKIPEKVRSVAKELSRSSRFDERSFNRDER